MQRRHAAKPVHLADRKIADSDGADLPLPEQRVHRLGGFFDRHQWVGPVNLVDIDVVGSKPAQGGLDLPHETTPYGAKGNSFRDKFLRARGSRRKRGLPTTDFWE